MIEQATPSGWLKYTWLWLLVIIAAFVVSVIRLHPTNFFGQTEDDSIYFSSAKGIAAGRGYLLLSFPGSPAATKYPIFYPWLLSWVWRYNPSFPSNLPWAIAITVAFGVLYIVSAYFFIKRFRNINTAEAIVLTGFCALHPVVLFYSGNVLSDIPFAALMLTAMLLAERASAPSASAWEWIMCGALVGFTLLTRTLGAPLVAGIVVVALLRRAWRSAVIFSLAVAPFFSVLLWHSIFPQIPTSPVSGQAALSPGWTHLWNYYTSYINDWKQGVPSLVVFWGVLKTNFYIFITTPAWYFLGLPINKGLLVAIVLVTVTGISLAGIIREKKARPVHAVLLFYCVIIMLWNYTQFIRFLVPFLPLFVVGAWVECKYILGLIRTSLGGRSTLLEKSIAWGLAAVLLAFVSAVAHNYFGGARSYLSDLSSDRASLLKEKRAAYEWLSNSSNPGARVIAYEDATAFLYTGRSASRPFSIPTVDFYDPVKLDSDIGHLTDVPKALNADFWIFSVDDYGLEWKEASRKSHAEMWRLQHVLPIVFESPHGRVRVFSLACLNHPATNHCELATQFALSGKP